MEVLGIVTEICDNNTIKVLIRRTSACGGNCHDCSTNCGGKSVITAKCYDNVDVGESVILYSKSNKALALSFAVFSLPLVLIVLLYKILILYMPDEIVSFISLFGGILLFLILILLFRKLKMPVCKKQIRKDN